MIDAFEEDANGRLPNEWKVLAFMPRRGKDLPCGQHTEMKKSDTNSYDWVSSYWSFYNILNIWFLFSSSNPCQIGLVKECMVLLKRGQNDTATTLGQKLASSWTEFVKACPKFNKDIPYVFRNATENAGPLNKFIMNKDVVVILKQLF